MPKIKNIGREIVSDLRSNPVTQGANVSRTVGEREARKTRQEDRDMVGEIRFRAKRMTRKRKTP